MAGERKDGGPAFPQHVAPAYRQEPEIWGMSLRDYYAGQALAGLCANPEIIKAGLCAELAEGERGGRPMAAAAGQLADAMLAEREKADA